MATNSLRSCSARLGLMPADGDCCSVAIFGGVLSFALLIRAGVRLGSVSVELRVLGQGHAAVDRDRGAGDPAGGGRGEEGDDVGNLGAGGDAAQRGLGEEGVFDAGA